jgi:hypothetical protein
MWTRARAVALVLAGLTLAACGNIHPGDAAVVDGHSISMKSFDDTAKIYCKLDLAAAKANGATSPTNAEVRQQAISGLVLVTVARKVAAAEGVAPKPQTYKLSGAQRDQVAKEFPSNADDVIEAIEDSRESSEIAIGLAVKATGTTRSTDNESQLAEAGQAKIVKAFPKYHVHFAPRFGLNNQLKQVSTTGSLSVADTKLNTDKQLPVSQRCT